MSASELPPAGISEEVWCKNRLQQYTQRASMPLPVYETFNEGSQHAPQFRSRVWVDGTCFTSPDTFSNRKMAEQDVAKRALVGIRGKVKNEGGSRILEDTVFCKSIINEYALKMNLKAPTYDTNESKGMLPMFVSSLILNGDTFIGDARKNKKEAEQFVARSAILSILDTEPGTTMSEIVKSKFRFYDALKKVKDSSDIQGVIVPTVANQWEERGALSSLHKRKEIKVSGSTETDPFVVIAQSSPGPFHAFQTPLSECTSEQPSGTQPLHEFKRAKPQNSLETIAPPIVFVPPASEHPQICSTSRKKRNRKNKKAKDKVQDQSSLTDTEAVMPQTQVPACSVTQ